MISWDDFKKEKNMLNYEETDIACPKCGAAIWKSFGLIIGYPPKHKYMCFKCGWAEVGR